jgi:hypothetical protein
MTSQRIRAGLLVLSLLAANTLLALLPSPSPVAAASWTGICRSDVGCEVPCYCWCEFTIAYDCNDKADCNHYPTCGGPE